MAGLCGNTFPPYFSVSRRVIFKQGAYEYLSFLDENYSTVSKHFLLGNPLLAFKCITAYSAIALLAFYACAILYTPI